MIETYKRFYMPRLLNGKSKYHRKLTVAVIFLSFGLFASTGLGETITAMEYYVDYDPGVGKATPIPPVDGSYDSTYETGEVSIDTTGLVPGAHLVYVRARKSNGA